MQSRPLVAEISLHALASNYGLIKKRAGASEVFAVAKANGYGHGLRMVTLALNDVADGYAFVDFGSARKARKSGFGRPILMLNGMFDARDGQAALEENLWLVLRDEWQCEWCESTPEAGKLKVFLKVDTGMNRLGLSPERARKWIPKLMRRFGKENLTLMTHLARADERDGARDQMSRMQDLLGDFDLPVSVSNSAATFFQHVPFRETWKRCGIALYGSSPAPAISTAEEMGLHPAMNLKTKLISVRTLRKGEWIGYGRGYKAPRTMLVGHAACGYGDGYPRAAGEAGAPVLVNGKKTRLVGRVSMDLLAVDLAQVPGAKPGDDVVLFGPGLPAELVASACKTIGYEIYAGVSLSVPRKAARAAQGSDKSS